MRSPDTMRRIVARIAILALAAPLAFAAGYGDEGRPCTAADREVYQTLLQQAVYAEWRPPRADSTYSCVVVIAQNFRGEVLDVGVENCSDDQVMIRKSVEDAAYSASPLPLPENRACRERTVRVRLTHRAQGET